MRGVAKVALRHVYLSLTLPAPPRSRIPVGPNILKTLLRAGASAIIRQNHEAGASAIKTKNVRQNKKKGEAPKSHGEMQGKAPKYGTAK
jgi:hypothetical protein